MTSRTPPTDADTGVLAIVAACNEADRISSTLAALAETFPGAPLWVADDGSTDATAQVAEAAGARVVRTERTLGKGGAVTLAVWEALTHAPRPDRSVVLLCDGDLGDSAGRLAPLVESVRRGDADMAVAIFARRVGGGFGFALGFAGWAIRRRCGLALRAPISGQRALRAGLLTEVLPLAPGFGMEIGMTIDAVRAGARVREVELDLSHRATGRTLGGFVHRAHQLIDFARAYLSRR